ncbi:MAG: hypothetical protein ACRD9Q_11355 [Nitrososphaeraceae archaeon]
MEQIDRKFTFTGYCTEHQPVHQCNEFNAMIFLAKDICLPDLLDSYHSIATIRGAKQKQLDGILLLRDRIIAWQKLHPEEVKIPDVDEGYKGDYIIKANEK